MAISNDEAKKMVERFIRSTTYGGSGRFYTGGKLHVDDHDALMVWINEGKKPAPEEETYETDD